MLSASALPGRLKSKEAGERVGLVATSTVAAPGLQRSWLVCLRSLVFVEARNRSRITARMASTTARKIADPTMRNENPACAPSLGSWQVAARLGRASGSSGGPALIVRLRRVDDLLVRIHVLLRRRCTVGHDRLVAVYLTCHGWPLDVVLCSFREAPFAWLAPAGVNANSPCGSFLERRLHHDHDPSFAPRASCRPWPTGTPVPLSRTGVPRPRR